MNPAERWRKVESLYHAAQERRLEERAAFLAAACSGDDGLRQEVQARLDDQSKAQNWVSTPAIQVAARMATSDAPASLVGRRIGVYQIISLLGAGGMGDVYRARDTKLGRDVAIKVLPPAFTRDPDRLARFEREARVLASLNHPHIAAIYGLEESEGVKGLVLELVEGPTLAQRISQRRIPVDEAVTLAGQIAQALKAAHDRGILHRDLKPANIKLSSDGLIKVLDFGLAKIMTGDATQRDLTNSPTATIGATSEGMLLGTAAYMSPEQARGQLVDQRSDLWAFGCVLYEMLTGRAAFADATVSDTIAALLNREPDWQALPGETPASIHRLLRRCLRKDARRRLHDAADAQIELDEAISGTEDGAVAPVTETRRRLLWIAASVALLAAVAAVALPLWRARPPETSVAGLRTGPMTRLTWDSGLTTDPSISSDGRLIAYASDRSGQSNLDIWVQQSSGGPPIQLTTDPTDDSEPNLSPDGSHVAFRSERDGGGLYVVPALGGDARLMASRGRGPRFSPDGRSIAFSTGGSLAARAVGARRQTYVIPAAGGDPVQMASELASAGDPVWSPDGKELMVFGRLATSGAGTDADWWWVPLDGRAAVRSGAYERMRAAGILTSPPGGSEFPYPHAWTDDGVLFTATAGSADAQNIWTLAIDRRSGRAVGDPRQIIAGPGRAASPAVSRDGRLVFSDMVERSQLLGLPLDANAGRATGTPKPLRADAARVGTRASASQDGRLLVFGILGFVGSEVWMRDLRTGRERQLAATRLASLNPLISRTGQFVAYTDIAEERGASGGTGAGYVLGAQGGAPRKICDTCQVIGFPDDQHVLIETYPGGVWLLDVETRARVNVVTGTDADVRVSWNQQWIALIQNDSISVAPFTPGNPMKEQGLVPIAKRLTNADRATGWSPDDTILYLLLERDGFRCLYAIRIDPQTGRPNGDVFPVNHFHNARWRWGSTSRASAVVTGLFISGQYEIGGNVWMTTLNGIGSQSR